MTMTADIWKIIQDHKIQIQKSVESNIKFFSLISAAAAAAVTHSQLQTADFQATVAEDSTVHQSESVEFAHLTTADQKIYTTALTIYENKLRTYNLQ